MRTAPWYGGACRRRCAYYRPRRRRIALQNAQRRLAVDTQQPRLFEAARTRDSRRVAIEERSPAEYLAFFQHEPSRRSPLAAPDEELDAPGIEHEEVLGRVSRAIKHGSRGEGFTSGKTCEFIQRGGCDAVEDLADVERGRSAGKIERIALDRQRILL